MSRPDDAVPRPPSILVSASLHRSGSTLLQRYVTTATDIFVWGENGRLLQGLQEICSAWPREPHDLERYERAMAEPSVVERTFLPNLSPPVTRVEAILRDTVARIYRERPPGFRRWGWKDVGYGRDEIELVRRLFPDLDILLLVRNPWDVARSIRRKGWIDRRGYFNDIGQVATCWTERTAYYLELDSVDDGHVHLVQYEHLSRRIAELNRFLGVDGRESTWDEISRRKLGKAPTISRFDLTAGDVETIGSIAGDVASKLGYAPPSASRTLFGLLG